MLCVGGEAVEVVDKFKYLGTIFHCSQMLSRHAVPARALSGRRAYHITGRRMADLQLGSFAKKCCHRHRELNPPPPRYRCFS